MDIQNRYCENCGIDYRFQASGTIDQGFKTTIRHCADCHSAMGEALSKIEIKSLVTWVKVNDINIDDLIQHNEKLIKDRPKNSFPLLQRVYPEISNRDMTEQSITNEIRYNGATYWYTYFPSKKEQANINKKVRIDCKTGKVIRNEV